MTDLVLLWTAGFVGFCAGAIVVMLGLAIQERRWSRKLARQAEHGVDIVLPTGRRGQLLLAPEAAAQ
jgi:hypothetical protein